MDGKRLGERLAESVRRAEELLPSRVASLRELRELWRDISEWDAQNEALLADQELADLLAGYRETVRIRSLAEADDNLQGAIVRVAEAVAQRRRWVDAAIRRAEGLARKLSPKGPRGFLVHGHDSGMLFELKDYLQNVLGLPEPIVLWQQPNRGRTVIEKFEEHAKDIDFVMVLISPDDIGGKAGAQQALRGRQNVIFELGFFVGRLGRLSGRIILIQKGALELPSDLGGVVTLNVTGSVAEAGEEIRRELAGMETPKRPID